jgi:nitroreductase
MNVKRRTFLKSSAALLGSGMLLGSLTVPTAATGAPASAEENIWNVFRQRRSVRNFKPDAIPEADIVKILDAARTPPTSGNQQPWKFLVIRDRDKINGMKEACVLRALARFDSRGDKSTSKEEYETSARNRLSGYFSAPVYIVVLTDNNSQYPDYNHWDGPMAAGFLTLAARALGYGTVFVTDVIPDEVTKRVLNISDRYTRVCITPLGVPVEWPDSPPKKKLEEFIAYESL